MRDDRTPRRGWTLTETLVVIGILLMFVLVLLPFAIGMLRPATSATRPAPRMTVVHQTADTLDIYVITDTQTGQEYLTVLPRYSTAGVTVTPLVRAVNRPAEALLPPRFISGGRYGRAQDNESLR